MHGISFEEVIKAEAKLIVLNQNNIVLEKKENDPLFSLRSITENQWNTGLHYRIGLVDENPLYVFEFSAQEAQLYETLPLKQYLASQNSYWVDHLIKAKQILTWHKNSQFCSACGQKTQPHPLDLAKRCIGCARDIYPSLSPAVVVLITKGTDILLGRSPHFMQGVYSNLAGFIEAGESAEQAIAREVQEEVGIRVKNIRYFGSQSWPFENTFMLAFKAEYDSGELKIDTQELEDAKWFSIHELPKLPFKSSIARKMIDQEIAEKIYLMRSPANIVRLQKSMDEIERLIEQDKKDSK